MKKELVENYIVSKYRIVLGQGEWYCKACGKVHKGSVPKFCPDCGAFWSDYFILDEGEIEEVVEIGPDEWIN